MSCVHAELTHRLHPCGELMDAKDGCVLPQTRVPAQITQQSRSQFTLEFQAHAQCNKTSRLTYERLEHGSACTASDPYTGYFLGSFGVHGPELLHLQRGLWDGEEAVIAHKITGTCYYCLEILHTYFILSSVRSAPLHQPPGFAKFRQALCFCFEGMLARYSPFASGFELSVAHVWAGRCQKLRIFVVLLSTRHQLLSWVLWKPVGGIRAEVSSGRNSCLHVVGTWCR
jgi:hypothetical protein